MPLWNDSPFSPSGSPGRRRTGLGPLALLIAVSWDLILPAMAGAHFVDQFLPFSPEQSDQCVSGTWGGHRNTLYDAGVSLDGIYAASFLGNPVGGRARGFAYGGMLTLGMKLDFEKLVGLPGSSIYTSAAWATGRSLTNDYIGNTFPASTIFGGQSLRLYQMYVQQKALDGRVELRVGRIVPGNDFAVSPLYNLFLSLDINGNPIGLPLNDTAFQTIPVATWGARAAYQAGDTGFYARFAAYNGSARNLGLDSAHGVDFGFDPSASTLLMGETGFQVAAARDTLGGRYRVGGYFDTGALPMLANPSQTRHGLYTAYALIDQQVTQAPGDDPSRGLSVFAALAISPRDDLSVTPYSGAAGCVYKGPFEGRADDQAAIDVAYGALSPDASQGIYELVTELTYVVSVTPWFNVQPDLQVIVHPGLPTAVVVGGALNLSF